MMLTDRDRSTNQVEILPNTANFTHIHVCAHAAYKTTLP